MAPPIWSCLLAVGVAEGAVVDEVVDCDVDEGDGALSDCLEVNPTPKPTASATTNSAAIRTAQKTVRFKPQIRRLLLGSLKSCFC